MRKNSTASITFLLLFLLQVLQLSVSAQQPKYAADTEKKIKEVENSLGLWMHIEGKKNEYTLHERMAFYRANGVSIAVIKDYKIEWARGYGWADSAEQRPVTTATLFQAGSISKSVNGVGVLKLVQDGKLNLSADINDYLKSWRFTYDSLSKGKRITTSHLLSHTAGLTIHGFPGYEVGAPLPTLAQVLDGTEPANTKAVRSAFEPGLKYQYSGGGTTISQTIVEDISGKSYDEYMWENVLKPLGMRSSSYKQPPAKEKLDIVATAYYNDGKPVKGKYHIYPEQAAAGLWTNPSDLAKYIIETQLALQGKSSKVLSQASTKLRLTPFVDSLAALGVFINKRGDQTYFLHNGVDEGFVAQYYGSLEGGNGVVVMANTYNTAILNEIINSVASVYDWKGFYVPTQKKVVHVDDTILNTYLGNYKLNATISFVKEGGGLINILNGRKMNVHFTSDTDYFIIEFPGSEFSFLKDANNKVIGVQQKLRNNVIKFTKVL
ncbi:MAG TPA: serine hydrolase domain-containing protein [Segetibacter sp.]|jgi:CubicO group peptidase (beta-lactamase class C family)